MGWVGGWEVEHFTNRKTEVPRGDRLTQGSLASQTCLAARLPEVTYYLSEMVTVPRVTHLQKKNVAAKG